jgi:putative hydrolase of HD superfamily
VPPIQNHQNVSKAVDTRVTLQLLLDAQRLKRVPRTGWVMRGVPEAESVAGHSYGVAFIALLLAEMASEAVDRTKLLTIALLHDLPESIVGDMPSPAMAHFPPGAKQSAEAAILAQLLEGLASAERWRAWWQEFEDGTSLEGQLVRDADRLDMLIQAHVYEKTTGNRWLGEFWPPDGESPFASSAAQELYEELQAVRRRSSGQVEFDNPSF